MPSLEERIATWRQAKYHVHGHPRSGTHYLMAVLNENFIHRPGPFRDAFGHDRHADRHLHGLPEQSDPTWYEEGRHFYIWREFSGVAASILKMPERFGIAEKLTLDEFRNARWSEIYAGKIPWKWRQIRSLDEEGKVERGNGTAFGTTFHQMAIDWNTHDFWEHHVKCWKTFSRERDNIYVLKYEDLINDFQGVMEAVACWLGEEVTSFSQVRKKVSGQSL